MNINDFINMQMSGFTNTGYQKEYDIQIYLGESVIEHKKQIMNDFMAEQNFRHIVNQLMNEKSPMKVIFSYIYYHPMGDKTDSITFTNKAMDNAYMQ